MTTKTKPTAKKPAPRPVAFGRAAVDANRRRVRAELYESWDARRAVITRIQSDFALLEEDLMKEDYDSARAILHGWLLTVEGLDSLRETLGRPMGDSDQSE